MRGRNVLKRCCYRSLRENRKRTVVTVIGIVLATALIMGVACLAVSFRASMVAYEAQKDGDYHYRFLGVAPENLKYFENNQYIRKYGLMQKLGYAPLEGSRNEDKPYLYLSAIERDMESTLALHLISGRMPENDRELAVGVHVRSNGSVDIKVGDVLTLQIGDRVSDGYRLGQDNAYLSGDGEETEEFQPYSEKRYTVVGLIERPSQELEPRIAPGYSAFTLLERPEEAQALDVYVSYTKKGLMHAEQVTAGILGGEEELRRRYYNNGTDTSQEQAYKVARKVDDNYWLLKWELLIFSSRIMNMLYAMCGIAILIIIVTSIFCIHNSFVISLTEKMKLYGRLASVGMTARQQRKIVYYEAMLLGLTGIPLGLAGGIGASVILVRAVGGLVEDAMGFGLIFQVSFPAILLAALLSGVTIYFSASGSARRAAKISPISAIRANDTVKLTGKELRCPGWIGKLFGIGGRIAYKNLKRAKVKYRTTVVSIVVSVAVFIGMTTFTELILETERYYNRNMAFQLRVSIYQWDSYGQALEIAALEGVREAEILRAVRFPVDSQVSYPEEYLRRFGTPKETVVTIRSLGEEAYARYCQKVGVSVEEARDKAILLADYSWESWKGGKLYTGEGEIARFRPGETLRGTGTAEGLTLEVLTQTEEKPGFLTGRTADAIVAIVSDEWMERYSDFEGKYDNIDIYVNCDDADRIEEIIRTELQLAHFTVTNYDAEIRSDRSMHLVVAIFLYGFLTVVALIGITNIFNTITTNMELRTPEFAMLKSVGMTGREFRRMIWLEGLFYGGKALLIGIPLGIALSASFNKAFGQGIVTAFRFPWLGTAGAAAAVVLLLYVIMHYSMGKINRKNIIETIQNENI